MVTVSVKQLIEAIEDADVYKFPDMTEGTDYLYNGLYKRLSYGENVRLSEIDYDSFELDDIDTMREIYTDVLECNEIKTNSLAHTLRNMTPAVAAAAFV